MLVAVSCKKLLTKICDKPIRMLQLVSDNNLAEMMVVFEENICLAVTCQTNVLIVINRKGSSVTNLNHLLSLGYHLGDLCSKLQK